MESQPILALFGYPRALLGSALLSEHGDRYTLDASLPSLAIPSTLQDSLMARLDQLGLSLGLEDKFFCRGFFALAQDYAAILQ